MSQDDDRNAPLPRMEREAALKWARGYTAHLADVAGVETIASTAKTHFEDCIGANGEVAEDGRYSLFYYINSPAPSTDHTRIVRTLRTELTKRGYEITSYREFKSAYESSALSARSKKDDYVVEADTVGDGKDKPQRFSFAVRTPCMLPPGAKQQQF
ncbi:MULTISPECIES: hypothetical protein [unclassified Streptomyces]|uniref:hypothetical protein n=1 Tax=unclassified Streptomyces TaxID=2593676 RepID=UPI000DBA2642|nr:MULTISPECIES: hypothetical protein [unclassified Streptomyces]MYT73313.1 hypothetical protein [Streptomyces sp. SID8367]RAJ74913.1 hypothetical protein K377_06680 [Streptomyces sp. PsTaAH-137]